jgi:hypothetical protein
MNPAEIATALQIESTLKRKGDYRKIDESLYVIKQGSTYVMINIVPWGGSRAVLRFVAQLVKGINLTEQLARELLHLNSMLRFGAFAYDPVGNTVLFQHSLLGGPNLDPEELLATLTDVALLADEYDDKIIEKYGGQTMRDLLEEAALDRMLEANPETFLFGGARA